MFMTSIAKSLRNDLERCGTKMTDKEVEIIDGVIRGILAFLSNPKNEFWRHTCINLKKKNYNNLYHVMDANRWLLCDDFSVTITAEERWQQCVDHALMILSKEYNYEQS